MTLRDLLLPDGTFILEFQYGETVKPGDIIPSFWFAKDPEHLTSRERILQPSAVIREVTREEYAAYCRYIQWPVDKLDSRSRYYLVRPD